MKNPKQKLKNILLLVTALFTFSCSKDAYEENLNLNTRDFEFKKINFQELSNINNQAFIESAKLKKVLAPDKHNSIESISDFDIDLQNIQYLKKANNQETFSFRVLHSATATFSQNIVIDCKPNQSPQTYLVTYYLNKQLGQISTSNAFENSITSTSIAPLNSSSSNVTNSIGCVDVGYYDLVDYCEGNVDTRPHCFNSDGTRRQVLIFKIIASDCSDDDGGFNSGANLWMNNPQNPSLGGGGGIGGSGQNSSNLDIFIPNFYNSYDLSVLPTNNMAQINQFINNLYSTDDDKKAVVESTEWLLPYTNFWIGVNGGLSTSNQNALTFAFNNMVSVFNQFPSTFNNQSQSSSFKYKAFQFLLQNGAWLAGQSATTQQSILQNLTSIEKIDKIDKLLDVAVTTDTSFEIDSNVNASNSNIFSNHNDITNFIINNNNSTTINSTITNINSIEKILNFQVNRTGIMFSGIDIDLKIKKQNSLWLFDNVTSDEYIGLAISYAWEQKTYTQNPKNNSLTVEVTGYETINVFYEGIGTIYKNKLKIVLIVNQTTGVIINANLVDLPG
jgi:hypothetical protein